ncbi:MAG: sulfite exporter TauE/SafE family protein [Anaerolineae bacterium]
MEPLVIPIIFGAMLIQSLAGFGSALIAMPFLIALLGPEVARPLFVLVGQTAGILYLYQYRADWQIPDIKLLIVGTLLGIPFGTWIAYSLSQEMFMLVLGIIIMVYALYNLSGFKLKQISARWAPIFGFCSGILHSAYNVGGPPLVMYNASQTWKARRFKGNTQAVFFITGMFVIIEHVRTGHVTAPVIQHYLIMAPTMILALWLGFRLEKYIQQATFQKLVMALLLMIGISLVL